LIRAKQDVVNILLLSILTDATFIIGLWSCKHL